MVQIVKISYCTFAFVLVISSFSLQVRSEELILQRGDDDTIACFDNLSMSKYRERCSNNFPEIKGKVETAFQAWRTANASRLRETTAACQERFSVLNKNDPIRLDQLRKYAADEHSRFIAPMDSNLIANAREDCKVLINELTDPQSAMMVPEYLADRIRNVTLKVEFTKTNLELKFGEVPIALDLRLIVDGDAPNSEILKQTIKTYTGDRIDYVHVLKNSLIGKRVFNSLKINISENDGFAVIGLSTTPDGAKRLEETTRANTGKLVALVLNQEILSIYKIQEKIPIGSTFSVRLPVDAAKEMAKKINAALLQK